QVNTVLELRPRIQQIGVLATRGAGPPWVPRVGQSCIDKRLVNHIARVARIVSRGVEVAAEHQWQRGGVGGQLQQLSRMRQYRARTWNQVHGHEAQWQATNDRIDRNVAAMADNLVKWRWQWRRCDYRCRKVLRLHADGQNIDIGPHQDRAPVREVNIKSEQSGKLDVLAVGHGSDQGVGLAECLEIINYGLEQVHLDDAPRAQQPCLVQRHKIRALFCNFGRHGSRPFGGLAGQNVLIELRYRLYEIAKRFGPGQRPYIAAYVHVLGQHTPLVAAQVAIIIVGANRSRSPRQNRSQHRQYR